MLQKVFIYGLYDPRNGELRYIGKTIDLQARLWGHVARAQSGEKSYKSSWILQLLKADLYPIIEVLEETGEENWSELEEEWIAKCLADGARLTNLSDGGEDPPNWTGTKQSPEHIRKRVEARQKNNTYWHSERTKKKMSETKKGTATGKDNPFYGKIHSEESKRKMSVSSMGQVAWNKGIPHTEETKEKLRLANAGRVHTEEAKLKMSLAQLGKTHTEETKGKLRLANIGKTHTKETKGKLSKSIKEKWNDPEYRQRITEANIGNVRSEETKQKISERLKGHEVSRETKAKISKARKGKPLSEEHKANLKKAWIKRKARMNESS